MPRCVRSLAATLLSIALVVSAAPAAWAGGGMQIFVVTPAGTTLTLDVESSDSIENVRQKIHDQTGILPERQLLTFNGVTLLDTYTLAAYSVVQESRLMLLPSTPLTFSTLRLPPFVLDAPSSAVVRASGGFGVEVRYAVTAGVLPAGIVLDETTGALSGTPRASGPWSFTLTATAGGVTATQAFSGTIAPQLAATGAGSDPGALAGAAGLLALLGVALLVRARRGSSLTQR